FQLARALMSSGLTNRPSSKRRRFSRRMRREKGSVARLLTPCFSRCSRRWTSKDFSPPLRLSAGRQELHAVMVFTVIFEEWRALYDNRNQSGARTVQRPSVLALLSGLHFFATDLQVEAVRIFHVKTVLSVRLRVESAALELGLDDVLVPIVDGIGDMVDA